MSVHPLAKKSLLLGALLLGLGVLIGAFGAHGIKNLVSPEKMTTFETGVRYHFYHALGLMVVGIIQQLFQHLKLNFSFWAFLMGITFFSFNCYVYVLSGIKVFAMLVPIGGTLFFLGWGSLFFNLLKLR